MADLQKMSTENEILRATGAMSAHGSPDSGSNATTTYAPKDFYSNILKGHGDLQPSHRVVMSDDGERLLGAAATWDYIISHEQYKRGLVDVGDVSSTLSTRAKCDGHGPVFAEGDIIEAIERSVASGSDDLL